MAQALRQPLTWDDYLAWEALQEFRYELVDGQVYAMGGGTLAHDMIESNLHTELRRQLRGTPCRRGGPNVKVQTGNGNGRYPDGLIDCGPFVPDAVQAQIPTAVFEILSRSTVWMDQNTKFDDYDATPSIKHYVLIFQDTVRVMVYARADNGWLDRVGASKFTDLNDVATLGGITLPLSALYDGLDLTPA